MPQAKDISHQISESALGLIAARGWDALTLDAIAKAMKVPVAQVKRHCSDTYALLSLIVLYVSDQTFKSCGKPDKKSAPRDRLFEIFMARFDVLQQHRKAVLSLIASIRRDPRMAIAILPAQIEAMKEVLRFAELRGSKTCPPLTPAVLWVIFAYAGHAWQGDETVDMSKTMAALDRALRVTEKAASMLRVDLD